MLRDVMQERLMDKISHVRASAARALQRLVLSSSEVEEVAGMEKTLSLLQQCLVADSSAVRDRA